MTMPRIAHHRRLRRSKGVGLITAIFLLVVLAGLGVAMVSISSSQHSASGLDVQGARAYQAARAGIEWGLYQNMRNSQCPAVTSFPLPATSSLNGFVVTVTCQVSRGTGGVSALDRHVLTATACNLQPPNGACLNPSNSPDYVERQIVVTI